MCLQPANLRYTEPINSRRFRYVDKLSNAKKEKFKSLLDQYFQFGMTMLFVGHPQLLKKVKNIDSTPESVEMFKESIAKIGDEYLLSSNNFRQLLFELFVKIDDITNKFNDLFGENIFA